MIIPPPSGVEPPKKAEDEPIHWMVRKDTIRMMWIIGAVLLALLTLADLLLHKHPYFALEGTFGFASWYGFVTCVIMVAFSKGLGIFLKRRDDYYDD